jgi:hypothetical protein
MHCSEPPASYLWTVPPPPPSEYDSYKDSEEMLKLTETHWRTTAAIILAVMLCQKQTDALLHL